MCKSVSFLFVRRFFLHGHIKLFSFQGAFFFIAMYTFCCFSKVTAELLSFSFFLLSHSDGMRRSWSCALIVFYFLFSRDNPTFFLLPARAERVETCFIRKIQTEKRIEKFCGHRSINFCPTTTYQRGINNYRIPQFILTNRFVHSKK